MALNPRAWKISALMMTLMTVVACGPTVTPSGRTKAPPAPKSVDIPQDPDAVYSAALRKQLAAAVGQALRGRAAEGQAPANVDEASIDAVIEVMRQQMPDLLRVSPQQEELFTRGIYNDQANTHRVRALLLKATSNGAQMPAVGRHLADQFQQGLLQGAALEMTRRLMDAYDRAGLLG